ncbi:MAG: DNA polymerase I [Candidatus Doudnabacteria bacterium]|nr:DNA polymerase I [Candidatus Doudnabacteria bacterium]
MGKNDSQKLLLVDGNALMHRSYHALPPMTTASGDLVNAVYGFTSTLFSAFEQLKPTHVAVMFDAPGGSFRNQLDETYKANRPKGEDELYEQFPRVKRVVKALNLPMLEIPGYEADDVIGTLSKTVGIPNVILTGDNDALQLVDDDTKVFTFKRGMKESVLYDDQAVLAKYGLRPDQLTNYKGLAGDTSDNIPGVPGVGDKTAVDLLQKFETIEGIYDYIDATDDEKILKEKVMRPKVLENLKAHKEDALRSRELGTIVTDIKDLPFTIENSIIHDYDREEAVQLFGEFQFKSLLRRLPETSRGVGLFADVDIALSSNDTEEDEEFTLKAATNKRGVVYQSVDEKGLDKFVERVKRHAVFAFDTETTSQNPMDAELVGLSFCWQEGEAWYVPAFVCVQNGMLHAGLVSIFEDADRKKVLQNAKYDVKVLRGLGVRVRGLAFDTMLASYLLASGTRRHNLDDLALSEFGYEMMSFEQLVGKGKTAIPITDVDPDRLTFYACEDADYTWRLYTVFKKRIEEVVDSQESVPAALVGGEARAGWNLQALFDGVELPLVDVLADMELAGITLDTARLKRVGDKVTKRLEELEQGIYKQAGRSDFNINSTQQLAQVLFDDLGLSTKRIKRTKSGFSTAASELEKLRSEHPIIELIEEYRELEKLRSTYISALPEMVRADTGRIHTDFNQAVAATGRLSSNDPNLQNIPIRSETGKTVRDAFVAEKGSVLLSADYSQIDLRVLAHMSGDAAMCQVFKEGRDIHASTAALMFGKELDDVTKDERRAAKEINFGIVYGMGATALSRILGISRTEATDFIARYLETYKGVGQWREAVIEFAYEEGYVETIFGRRRNLPDLQSGSPVVQAAAERIAGNHPIQGTTADIIKVAMVNLAEQLRDASGVRMLLQVHDELVLEVPEKQVSTIAALVREEMEGAAKLDVPLTVDVAAGQSWNQLETL